MAATAGVWREKDNRDIFYTSNAVLILTYIWKLASLPLVEPWPSSK